MTWDVSLSDLNISPDEVDIPLYDIEYNRVFIDIDSFERKGGPKRPNHTMFKFANDRTRYDECLPDVHYCMDNGTIAKFRISKLARDFGLCRRVYVQADVKALEANPCGCVTCNFQGATRHFNFEEYLSDLQ